MGSPPGRKSGASCDLCKPGLETAYLSWVQGAWEGTVYLQGLVAEGQTWEVCVHLLWCRVGSHPDAPWEVRAARTLSGTQCPLSWARAGENTGEVCPSLGGVQA